MDEHGVVMVGVTESVFWNEIKVHVVLYMKGSMVPVATSFIVQWEKISIIRYWYRLLACVRSAIRGIVMEQLVRYPVMMHTWKPFEKTDSP